MKKACVATAFFLLTLGLGTTRSSAQFGAVQGLILKAPTQQPIPGLTVSLIHPVLGRSAPSFTDAYGRYAIVGIPLHVEPYYLEVYWGPSLVYRVPVQVLGPVTLPPIYL